MSALLIERPVSPAPDGLTTVFVLPSAAEPGSIRPLLNGVVHVGHVELSESAFELDVAPREGAQLRAWYVDPTLDTGSSMISVPVGAVDGANRLFTTPASAAYAAGELRLILNGVVQPPGAVYETDPTAGTFIVMTDHPPDPARDDLLIFWINPNGSPVVTAGVHVDTAAPVVNVAVEPTPIVTVTTEEQTP